METSIFEIGLLDTVIFVLGPVVLITIIYKNLPFRETGDKKPFIAFVPKYRKTIYSKLAGNEIESILSGFGFKKVKEKGERVVFTRGSILADFSIEQTKLDVGINRLSEQKLELTVKAGGVVAFDTGDHWTFITKLGEKLETA
mgnify:CR=1 FL=1